MPVYASTLMKVKKVTKRLMQTETINFKKSSSIG
ncbi:hypothetical protein CLV59_102760 [Chitinophaga dinghuensis]|uniref:Uncharacterized protein n=1 Tax=Chitinophaga dinghuensis TaxID=1539050 RepID=A0A327W6A9_9BACT|nr:hypothetical protein CLV59_102760 [Chitinophaga dinghuensis]